MLSNENCCAELRPFIKFLTSSGWYQKIKNSGITIPVYSQYFKGLYDTGPLLPRYIMLKVEKETLKWHTTWKQVSRWNMAKRKAASRVIFRLRECCLSQWYLVAFPRSSLCASSWMCSLQYYCRKKYRRLRSEKLDGYNKGLPRLIHLPETCLL